MKSPNKKRGKKIHWSAEGLDHAPCGHSTTYYHGVSLDEFGNLDKKQRCLRCNNAHYAHVRGFLYADKIYKYKRYLGLGDGFNNLTIMLNRLILSCTYDINSSEPYQKMKVEYIDFTDDFTYTKRSVDLRWSEPIWLDSGAYFRNNEVLKSPEEIKNIKRLIKLL